MDLFGFADSSQPDSAAQPLAERLRPKTLEDMLGQPKILGERSTWRRLIEAGSVPSLILWGPPGCGKTTFALLLAKRVDAEFVVRNAVDTGAKALRELGEAAYRRRLEHRRKTLLFIDEIHRLNKAQQDVLLPFVERGDLTLVGATTENPSYEINNALLSRCRVLVFERLDESDLQKLIDRAAATRELDPTVLLTDESRARLIELSDGDARKLINMMELLLEARVAAGESWVGPLDPVALAQILDVPSLRYDRNSDEHYDTISAFIKSVRGSDPNAAVYYLARMISGGEDPVFIARRLVILASEDVGNADPRAISVAVAGLQAVELVGWPEAAITLAQVTTYLASAPKSNRAYVAFQEAQAEVARSGTLPIPLSLRSAKTSLMKQMGYGRGYKYSHEGPKGYVPQVFLPEEIQGKVFYDPTDRGFEKNIRQYLEWMKNGQS
ncbi:MAG: replication-associated recombination protein A [Bdellovibrionaceae bacterium]|nr:replication-associated recombination protein A [Pseudobdellovibrionaceae bacterium]